MTTSFDQHKNFAISAVQVAPSPAVSGTTLAVTTTDGAKFPTPPFNATVWPAGSLATDSNAEIVRCTGLSGDTLTIVRAQEGTTAQSIAVGYQIALTATTKTFTDIEGAINQIAASGVPTSSVIVSNTSAQTLLIGKTIPANYLTAGQAYKVTAFGVYSTTGTPALIFSGMLGGPAGTQLVASPAITTPSSVANYPFRAELLVTMQSATSAAVQLCVDLDTTSSTETTRYVSSAIATVSGSSAQSLEIDVKWNTASASNTVTCQGGFVQQLG